MQRASGLIRAPHNMVYTIIKAVQTDRLRFIVSYPGKQEQEAL